MSQKQNQRLLGTVSWGLVSLRFSVFLLLSFFEFFYRYLLPKLTKRYFPGYRTAWTTQWHNHYGFCMKPLAGRTSRRTHSVWHSPPVFSLFSPEQQQERREQRSFPRLTLSEECVVTRTKSTVRRQTENAAFWIRSTLNLLLSAVSPSFFQASRTLSTLTRTRLPHHLRVSEARAGYLLQIPTLNQVGGIILGFSDHDLSSRLTSFSLFSLAEPLGPIAERTRTTATTSWGFPKVFYTQLNPMSCQGMVPTILHSPRSHVK
jgi:hypothetical protein